ncbi:hypothetical protein PthstB1num2_36480 [Parageobacillus thermoglucosidasius]|nr:hypothetical protein PthstB1num2_36480 [Parageobacillus thermoglucosidasius]
MFLKKVVNISISSMKEKGNYIMVNKISKRICLCIETTRDGWIFRKR